MKLSYRKDIDGLRAISIVAVLIFHFFPKLAKGGFMGVDIFFVISGYLITNILLFELKLKKFSLISFFVRRIRRIFPALIFMLIVTLLSGYYLLFADEFKLLAKHIIGNSFFSINLVLYGESGYFDIISDSKPLLHLWSLSVEEQFYFFYPLIILLATRKNINIVSLIIAVIVLSFFLNIKLLKYPNMSFYMSFTRAWELLFGGALVYINKYTETNKFKNLECKIDHICEKILFSNIKNRKNLFRNIICFLGGIIIISCVVSFKKTSSFPGVYALLPVLGAGFVICSGPQSWINKEILSSKLFVGCGKISYPIYLWHWPLLSFAIIIFNEKITIFIKILLIFLSVVLASITYFFIEKPIKKVKNLQNLAIIGIVLIIMIGLFGGYIFYMNGMPNRGVNNLSTKPGLSPSNSSLYLDLIPCSSLLPSLKITAEYCYGKSYSPEIAIIGDSHAIATGYGAIKLNDMNAIFISYSGGLPFRNYVFYNQKLHQKTQRIERFRNMVNVINAVAQMNSIKYVVLNNRGPIYLMEKGFGIELETDYGEKWAFEENNNQMEKDSNYHVFIKEYESIIKQIHGFGKKVVFLIDVPELGINPKDCISRFIGENSSSLSKCFVERKIYDKRNFLYRKMLQELKKRIPSLIIFDPIDSFCDKEKCYGIKNHKLLYSDNNHLSDEGGDILARELKNFLINQL